MPQNVSDQEEFWRGNFGDAYSDRNNTPELIGSNIELFAKMVDWGSVDSVLELGCNIGFNLMAIHSLNKKIALYGVDLNKKAVQMAAKQSPANVFVASATDQLPEQIPQCEFVFSKLVLIHCDPSRRKNFYKNLFDMSSRYICICEYHNQTPIELSYRGFEEKLFKDDFAGEFLELFDVSLKDYGFIYHRDISFRGQDDMNWFLFEK